MPDSSQKPKGGCWFVGSVAVAVRDPVDPKKESIFCIPFDAEKVLVIDVGKNVMRHIGPDLGKIEGKWRSGAVAGDGLIYCPPCNETRILVINPQTDDVWTVDCDHRLDTNKWSGAWSGAVAGEDGCIYGVPHRSGEVLRITPPTTHTTNRVLDLVDKAPGALIELLRSFQGETEIPRMGTLTEAKQEDSRNHQESKFEDEYSGILLESLLKMLTTPTGTSAVEKVAALLPDAGDFQFTTNDTLLEILDAVCVARTRDGAWVKVKRAVSNLGILLGTSCPVHCAVPVLSRVLHKLRRGLQVPPTDCCYDWQIDLVS